MNCNAHESMHSHENSYIEGFEGNKIYLKPSNVYVAKNGIFINVDNEFHLVNCLEKDARGVYLDINKEASLDNIIVGDCKHCGDATVFGICMNSQCSGKKKN